MSIQLEFKTRLLRDDEIAIGPGKADLLESINEFGSISAAARSLKISYRRAWLMVDTMNRSFKTPLVDTSTGGKRGGGARVTPAGDAVLMQYRAIEDKLRDAARVEIRKLKAMLLPSNR